MTRLSYEQARGTTVETRLGIKDQRHCKDVWLPHYVYRCYDATDRLIYVGCSWSPPQRIDQHRKNAWWGYQIVTARSVVFPDRLYALERERQAIEEEAPRWNVKGRWQHRALWTAEDYTDYHQALVMAGNTGTAYGAQHLKRVLSEAGQRYGLELGRAA